MSHETAVETSPRIRRSRIVTALLATLTVVAGLFVASTAQAVTYELVIDSAGTGADANAGNGVCATSGSVCTLRAALQEANTLNASGAHDVTIVVAPALAGQRVSPTLGDRMRTASVASSDGSGAYFEVLAPMTIDLGVRDGGGQVIGHFGVGNTTADVAAAAIHVNATGVTLRNLTGTVSGGSSFVMGPNADDVLLEGGSTVTANWNSERFVTFREGARNITIRDHHVQGFWDGANTGLFFFNGQSTTPIRNIVIDDIEITAPGSTTCNGVDGEGCRSRIVAYDDGAGGNERTTIDGFSFTNSTVQDLDRHGFRLSGGTAATSITLSDLTISGNRFINVAGDGTGTGNAFVTLPSTSLGGTNTIADNAFVRASTGQTHAISWNGQSAATAGDLTIAGNHFDGYSTAGVWLQNTARATVEKNTFGAGSASQTGGTDGSAEETVTGAAALVDNGTNANGQVNTWYPQGTATVTGALPGGVIETVSPLPPDAPRCIATVQLAAPAAPAPAEPATIDLYWTADRTAELYLGRVTGAAGTTATITVPLPVGPQPQPTTTVGGTTTVTAVNATTGAVSGRVRVQSASGDPLQSSQYSRWVALSGTCAPTLSLDRAAAQNDPTRARDLHFTLVSTVQLDPATVTADDFTVTADAIAETSQPGLLNPRIVSVTPVAGSSDTRFDVIARVDDSATATVTLAAGRVTSVSGQSNALAASFIDNTVTFLTPLTITPASFTLVTGDPVGKDYTIGVYAGAPAPTADLTFASTLDAAGTAHDVVLSTDAPVIPADAYASVPVAVTSAYAGDVAAGTPVVVSHTITTTDPHYDGLVVPSLHIRLFATDPAIQIRKRAYLGATDTSTPQQIEATGTEVLSGARLLESTGVCFVYTVTNISQEEWATTLTDAVVTDSDTRLGESGVIGHVAALPIGESAKLSACAVLIPVDTTTGESP